MDTFLVLRCASCPVLSPTLGFLCLSYVSYNLYSFLNRLVKLEAGSILFWTRSRHDEISGSPNRV